MDRKEVIPSLIERSLINKRINLYMEIARGYLQFLYLIIFD